MEAFLPDWSSGSNGYAALRSVVNPVAALCEDCGPGGKRLVRAMNRQDRASIGVIKQKHITVPPGTDIVMQGERGRGVYSICDGWAVRYQRLRDGSRQILDVLLPGDTAGLASVISGGGSYSVQALTSATVCVLNGKQIVGLLKTNPDFAFGVLRTRLEEERRVDARLSMIGRMSADEKVGYLTVEIYDRLRRRGMADATSCPFPLRRADLADAIGLSKVHVLRALRGLRSNALMEIKGRELLIPDVERLAGHAGYLLT